MNLYKEDQPINFAEYISVYYRHRKIKRGQPTAKEVLASGESASSTGEEIIKDRSASYTEIKTP
jgi:hypothetical protein